MGQDATKKRSYTRCTIPIEDRKKEFLRLLAMGNTIQFSCKNAKISSATIYRHEKTDKEFAAKYREAEAIGGMYLEDEAWRRAIEGNEEPIFYKGQVCGYVNKRSDRLLEFLLKARFPQKYTERRIVHEGQKVPIEFNIGIDREPTSDKLPTDTDTDKVPSLQ